MSKVYSSVRLLSQTIFRFSLFLLLIACLMATESFAATFTVTTTADSGLGSLRGAIASANIVGSGPDTITFAIPAADAGCTGGVCTITLTSGQFNVASAATTGALTITNSTGANNLRISGGGVSRVFSVDSGGNLTLDGLTVTNGYNSSGFPGGAGILNSGGTLTVTNSIISGNTGYDGGGGIYNNGGGIYNAGGTLTITNSTVSGNSAGNGGGITNDNGGIATITNSTISGNTALFGGGINNFGTLNLTNVTVTNNNISAGTSFGGGIFNLNGVVNLNNTIVAGNIPPNSIYWSDYYGSISSTSSNNLIGDGSFMFGITNGSNGNQVGTFAMPINPMLGPLTLANGGQTPTHAILAGSTALDAGSNAIATAAGLTTDQRGTGFPRIVDGNGDTVATVDIGAFEYQGATPTNKNQCKNGGWMFFDFPREFKNQGDCIQFINTGK